MTREKGNENDTDVQNHDFVRDEIPHQEYLEVDVSEDKVEMVRDDDTMQTMDQSKSEKETRSVVTKLEDSFDNTKNSEISFSTNQWFYI